MQSVKGICETTTPVLRNSDELFKVFELDCGRNVMCFEFHARESFSVFGEEEQQKDI